ncbi:hypothetical protein APHAL10511_004961 [Amanita phalloides]|nr:hypothetical protein APHAL10511_004961 [Amanita phalloides]
MSTRAEQRRLRQLEIEKEQRLEDDEALKMTDEQHQTLLRSFQSVKSEFYDLDGLSWTDSIRHKLRQDVQAVMSKPPFVMLTKADLASFAPEDTIRPSALRVRPSPCVQETQPSQHNSYFLSPALMCGKRNGTRARSPIKGLFAVSDTVQELPPSVAFDSDVDPFLTASPPTRPQTPTPPDYSGTITSIYCSPISTPTHRRKRSQTRCTAATPKSSPLLGPIPSFSAP